MNIITIMIKEIKHSLRDRKAMIMMVLFPIVLILILGAAFSKVFSGSQGLALDAKVLYTNESSQGLSSAFNGFKDKIGKELKVTFDETKDEKQGLKSVEESKYTCYIKVTDKNIIVYKNDRFNFGANLIESVFSTFIDRYNVIAEIGKVNPKVIPELISDTSINYVSDISLDKKHQPRALDYYAITMITLIIMYSTLTGAYSVIGEKAGKTGNRMITTPVTKRSVFIGKTAGSVLVTIFQILIVFLFSKYVIKAYWGDHVGTVLLIMVSEIAMAVSIGTGIALLTKNEAITSGILNVLIPVMVFLGGGYTSLDGIGSKLLIQMAKLSPVKWTNTSIIEVIYKNDFTKVSKAIIINLIVMVIFILISSFQFRKEQV